MGKKLNGRQLSGDIFWAEDWATRFGQPGDMSSVSLKADRTTAQSAWTTMQPNCMHVNYLISQH